MKIVWLIMYCVSVIHSSLTYPLTRCRFNACRIVSFSFCLFFPFIYSYFCSQNWNLSFIFPIWFVVIVLSSILELGFCFDVMCVGLSLFSISRGEFWVASPCCFSYLSSFRFYARGFSVHPSFFFSGITDPCVFGLFYRLWTWNLKEFERG